MTPTLQANPQQCPGGYAFHAYCKYDNPAEHGFGEFPWISTDCQTRGQALAAFRKLGWIFHKDRTATCPKCAKLLASRGEES